MEDLQEASKKSGEKLNFMNHVLKFDDTTKSDLFNTLQYAFLAIIPVVLLNKSVRVYIPEVDESKTSLEISIEILAQILVMFFGLYYIDRLVTFVPPYSGDKYEPYIVKNTVLGVLVIVLSLNTKLGEKVNILVDRVFEFATGTSSAQEEEKPKNGGPALRTQANSGGASAQFPMPEKLSVKSEASNGFDSMYYNTENPLVNANAPADGFQGGSPLMAANEALGGGFGAMF
tara:strand:+ start:377 stop:1069 length:693 start_codon:yes stop_codon:yes gene_type:complete